MVYDGGIYTVSVYSIWCMIVVDAGWCMMGVYSVISLTLCAQSPGVALGAGALKGVCVGYIVTEPAVLAWVLCTGVCHTATWEQEQP